MTFPEFISEVQARGGLTSTKEALNLTDATLSILGARVYVEPGERLGAGLPPQIREYFDAPYSGQNFGIEDFYTRVSMRAGIDLPTVRLRCAIVISVLRDAMQPGELEDIRTRLPIEYKPLFSWYTGMSVAA